MQSRFQHVGLDTHFTFGCDNTPWRHPGAEVTPFLDRDLSRADVHKNSAHHDQEEDEYNEADNKH
jgi:hypothetical protein